MNTKHTSTPGTIVRRPVASTIRTMEDRFIAAETVLEMEFFMLELKEPDSKLFDELLVGRSYREASKHLGIHHSTICRRVKTLAPHLIERIEGTI